MQYKHPFKLLDPIVKERASQPIITLRCFVGAESEKYIYEPFRLQLVY